MVSRITSTNLFCLDPYALAQWWQPVVGYNEDPAEPNEAGNDLCVLMDPDSRHEVLFIRADELQEPGGRMHFDLAPTDRTMDAEVERVLAHGATLIADRRKPDGTGWVVLADPEGNQFCIVRSDAERT